RYLFFLQAEDGIRDRNVTGVQTCALPISSCQKPPPVRSRNSCCAKKRANNEREKYHESANHRRGRGRYHGAGYCPSADHGRFSRSEERRVGKEWRAWWAGSSEKRGKVIDR